MRALGILIAALSIGFGIVAGRVEHDRSHAPQIRQPVSPAPSLPPPAPAAATGVPETPPVNDSSPQSAETASHDAIVSQLDELVRRAHVAYTAAAAERDNARLDAILNDLETVLKRLSALPESDVTIELLGRVNQLRSDIVRMKGF